LSRWSTGHADLIVSGDRDLLALNPFHEIPIAHADDLCAGGGEASPGWLGAQLSETATLSAQHGLIVDTDKGQDLVVSDLNRLLIDLIMLSVPAVEPRIGADLSGKPVFNRSAEEDVER
jgi:hypothetical protein